MTSTRSRIGSTLLAAVALVVALTACAPNSSGVPPTGGEGDKLASGDYESELAAWRTAFDGCLAEAGFDLPSPDDGAAQGLTGLTPGADPTAFEKAQEECLEEAGDPPVDPDAPTREEAYEMALAFAECMREAGYDYADPDPSGAVAGISADVDPEVVERCSDVAEKSLEGAS